MLIIIFVLYLISHLLCFSLISHLLWFVFQPLHNLVMTPSSSILMSFSIDEVFKGRITSDSLFLTKTSMNGTINRCYLYYIKYVLPISSANIIVLPISIQVGARDLQCPHQGAKNLMMMSGNSSIAC